MVEFMFHTDPGKSTKTIYNSMLLMVAMLLINGHPTVLTEMLVLMSDNTTTSRV